MTFLGEPRRADELDEDILAAGADLTYGTRPELGSLSHRARLAVLLSEAGVRFGERGLGALSAMCFLAGSELRSADDYSDRHLMQRLADAPGWSDVRDAIT